MLLLVCFIFFITFSCALAGRFIHSVFFPSREVDLDILTPQLINGLIFFSIIAQICCLFFPVDIKLLLLIDFLLLFYFLTKKYYIHDLFFFIKNYISKFHTHHLILLGAIILLVILYGAGPINMDDTESYHLQMVKWIHSFGTVPGIANLHERYGFNSAWFSLIALFTPSESNFNTYTALNASISCWLVLFIVEKLIDSEKNDSKQFALSFLVILFISVICWPLIRGNAGNTNYDFIGTLLIFILFIQFGTNSKTDEIYYKLEWIIWSAFLFTVRITNYPLILLGIWFIFSLIQLKKRKEVITSLFNCLLLFIPFIVRNYLVSGYPFYPSTVFSFNTPDWSVPLNKIDTLRHFIKYFNRINTMHQPLEITAAMYFPKWIPAWFNYLFSYDKPIVLIGIIGITIWMFSTKEMKSFSILQSNIVKFTMGVHFISWFCIAPDPRFIYGALLFGSFCLIVFISTKIRIKSIFQSFSRIIQLFGLLCFLFFCYSLNKHPDLRNYFTPLSVKKPPINTVFINGSTYYIPQKLKENWNIRCIESPLPCIYTKDSLLTQRGESIKSGFKIKTK